MGDTTSSMLYGFGAFLIIYIVGVLIYQAVQWVKKRREKKKDEEWKND
ncbi:MAG: hypothetical protein Q4C65_12185 [Eubacteriales bacterium]|nr:hypothetical protein [Eubacteriales bacterium]